MTKLKLSNNSNSPVLAYITLGATPGCVQDVADLVVSDGIVVNKLYPLMGNFMLPATTTVEITAPAGLGFNGNFSFGTPPLNCPCPDWPEGVALAEFIINNGFQPGGQETVDISCVCGANAFLGFDLSSDDWTTNGGAIAVKKMRNSTRYQNTGLVGVYPYGCDNCTASDAPPSCVGQQPQFANTLPICNVQRPASSPGGIVHVIFEGFTPVPL
jgi:hypothetical protein